MSTQAVSYVMENGATDSPLDRLVLVVLAHYARGAVPPWEAWPSLATIGRDAGIAQERTVRQAIRRLEKSGAIATVHGGGRHRPNRYRIVTQTPAPRARVTEGDTPAPHAGVITRAPRAGVSGETPAPRAPKPLRRAQGEQDMNNERGVYARTREGDPFPPRPYDVLHPRYSADDDPEPYADHDAYLAGLREARAQLHPNDPRAGQR